VSEDLLIDRLWPDAAGDAGRASLKITVHRLRRLIGDDEAIQRHANEVTINRHVCWVDAFAVQHLLDKLEAVRVDVDGESAFEPMLARLTRLYRGEFLPVDDASWVLSVRAALQRRTLHQLLRIGHYYSETNRWLDAARVYETAMLVDGCSEEACRGLMYVNGRLGRRAEVNRAYNRCRQNLITQLGLMPSTETTVLLQRMRSAALPSAV
jgi:DNA-binding SARP family transcriptional activator